jgi:hypothetical protein
MKGEESHTEITELWHRERGEVPAIFSVHSVAQEFDHSTRDRLCELRGKRCRIRPPSSLS